MFLKQREKSFLESTAIESFWFGEYRGIRNLRLCSSCKVKLMGSKPCPHRLSP